MPQKARLPEVRRGATLQQQHRQGAREVPRGATLQQQHRQEEREVPQDPWLGEEPLPQGRQEAARRRQRVQREAG